MINSDLTSLFKYLKKYHTLAKEAEKAIAENSKIVSIKKNDNLQSIGHTCKTIYFINLLISLSIFIGLLLMKRLKVKSLILYLIGGIFMWYFMLNSGVHATITGILLAFAIPFGDGSENTISHTLQNWLHKPVAFIIIPLFALSNTAIIIGKDWITTFSEKSPARGLDFSVAFGILHPSI